MEDVALGKNISAAADLERVPAIVVPVVVDLLGTSSVDHVWTEPGEGTRAYGVEERVTLDLRAAAAGVVDVVTLHGDVVV